MNDTMETSFRMLFAMPVKAVLSMTTSLIFLYINGVMLFSLTRKVFFKESSRYLLFGHLLLTDSLNLLFCMVMYIFAIIKIKILNHFCIILLLFGGIITMISPLNLAVMSLERYVAICFPLRHTQITTKRRTSEAIVVIWIVGSLDSVAEMCLYTSLENTTFTTNTFCTRHTLMRLEFYTTLNKVFTVAYFLLPSVVIIYTYIAILVTVRTALANTSTARKAHKTVLMHMLQLCLCLISTLFNTINSLSPWNGDSVVGLHIQYLLFVGLIIFPRCLSPLVYGLRDNMLKDIFIYYFTLGLKKQVKPSHAF